MIPTGSSALDGLLDGGYGRGQITRLLVDGEDGGLRTALARAAAKSATQALYVGLEWPHGDTAPNVLVVRATTLQGLRQTLIRAVGVVDIIAVDDPHSFDAGASQRMRGDDSPAVQAEWANLLREVGPLVGRSTTALVFVDRLFPRLRAMQSRASVTVHCAKGDTIRHGVERVGRWVHAEVNGKSARAALMFTGQFDAAREARLR